MSFGAGPSNSDKGGFYQPDSLPYPAIENYQEFLNTTDGTLDIAVLDALHNLISELPQLYSQQTLLAAEEVIWLRRLTYGPACINLSDTSDEDVISHCPICFGTGFVGGYEAPIKLKMSFEPQKADVKIEQAGLTIKQNPTAWTIDTDPIMKESDIIVTYSNERYRISGQESEEKQGKRVYQRLTLTRADKWDVVYDIPIPSVYGDYHKDFKASIEIRGPYTDFPASIAIFNYAWPLNPEIPET